MTAFLLLSVALAAPLASLGLPPHESLMKMQALTKASRPSASSLVQVENNQLRSMDGQLDGQLDRLRQVTTRLPGENRRRPYSMGIDKVDDPPTITFDLARPEMQKAPGVALFQRINGGESLVEKATARTEQPTNATNATKGTASLAEKATAKTEQPTTESTGATAPATMTTTATTPAGSKDQTNAAVLAAQAELAEAQMARENAAKHVKPPEILEITAPEEPWLLPLGNDPGAATLTSSLYQRGAAGWAVPLALVALLTER